MQPFVQKYWLFVFNNLPQSTAKHCYRSPSTDPIRGPAYFPIQFGLGRNGSMRCLSLL